VLLAILVCLASSACRRPGPVATGPPQATPARIYMDRSFQVLRIEGRIADRATADRARLSLAAGELGDWTIHLAGQPIDGARLARLAATPETEPLVRAVREDLRRAVDLEGFMFWLDDVLVAGHDGLRGRTVWVSPGRGRRVGVLVHPDAVYEGRPRTYGKAPGWLDVAPPQPQTAYPPARDGDPLGPEWTMRFQNPSAERAMLAALRRARPKSGFGERLDHLIAQLRNAGADVQVNSTVRHPERGYLMWGAFALGRTTTDAETFALCDLLDARNREWELGIDIRWRHPSGAEATRVAAREMAATYDVVYATEEGARDSRHYGGRAADFTAVGLPRVFELESPGGVRRRFDVSHPDETRDLSLTRELVEWLERQYGLEKLRADYPHWNDAIARDAKRR